MHVEAHNGFGQMLTRTGLDPTKPWRILDLGGQNVNGSVHDYFPNARIRTMDLENADYIADITTWRGSAQWDIVIATEVFEHVQDWPAVIATAAAALDPTGPSVFLTTWASDRRQPHGATGAPLPAPGEWYGNVPTDAVARVLGEHFVGHGTMYRYPPGDGYAWAIQQPAADGVTVVIPTIASRTRMLTEAHASVIRQTLPADAILVGVDTDRDGPAVVRNRLVEQVETEWVAFLDDDDLLHPDHLATLMTVARTSGADVVWPWFTVSGGTDPFPMHKGRQWNPDDPHQIPVTALVRTAAFRAVGGFKTMGEGPTDKYGNRCGEDWALWLALSAAGYRFHHVESVTWTWRHHAGNSSGLPSRVR